MTSTNLDEVFRAVASALNENKQDINDADQLHHDHGDNMVDIFNVISSAVEKKKSAPVSTQLNYASKQLVKKIPSGTAQLYAGGLKEASQKFSEKQIDTNSALDFVQTLMGAQQTVAAPNGDSSDLLGNMLTGMLGTQASSSQQANPGADFLTSLLTNAVNPADQNVPAVTAESPVQALLSGLMGGSSQADDGKFDLKDVLQIGMQYMQAKQSGNSDLQALANALLKSTAMGQKEHRAASGQVVAQTLLEQLSKANR